MAKFVTRPSKPVSTAVALSCAVASVLWAWHVCSEDAEVRPRAQQLKSPVAADRIAAINELTLLVSVEREHFPIAFPLILGATEDHSPEVRAQALVSLSDLGHLNPFSAQQSDNWRVARMTILEHFHDPDPTVREAAVASVARLGPVPEEALVTLTKLSTDIKHPSIRSVAVERLGQMRNRLPEALTAITRAVSDSDTQVRASAVMSLAPWASTDFQAIRLVFSSLLDEAPLVRAAARRILLDPSLDLSEELVPELISLIDLPDHQPGGVVAQMLPRIGRRTVNQAAPNLISSMHKGLQSARCLTDFSHHLRTLSQLGTTGPVAQQTRAVLERYLLSHPEPGSRQAAAWYLSQFGQHAAGSLPSLLKALSDPDPLVREATQRTIEHIDSERKKVNLNSLT